MACISARVAKYASMHWVSLQVQLCVSAAAARAASWWLSASRVGLCLTGLAGLQDMQTPELKVAIKSAQRLAERMLASGGPRGASPPGTPIGFRA